MKKMKLTLVMLLLLPIISMAQHFGGVGRGDYSLSYTDPVVVTATLGTAGPTVYLTLKAAFDAINLGTHQGVITVKINAGTNEIASAVLNASGSGSYPNISSYTAINIYPTVTGLTISGAIAGPLVDLNGADKVTIDGRVNQTGSKDLTIVNTYASVGNGSNISAIRFINSAENNKIKYCTVKASALDNLNGGIIVFSTSSAGNGNSGNRIDNCDLTQDANRPYRVVYSLGSAGYENKNDTVFNCNIYNFFKSNSTSNGIFITSFSTDWVITGNNFYETTPVAPAGGYSHYFIRVDNTSGNNFTISDNFIGGTAPNHTGTWTVSADFNHTFRGIYLNVGSTTASSVQNNTIQGIAYTSTSTEPWYGIYINNGDVNVGTVTGNTIGSTTGTGSITVTNSTANARSYGIHNGSSSTVGIQNNKIGSITTVGSATFAHDFTGIYKSATTGTTTISNNTIGSATEANSINASSVAADNAQSVTAIYSEGAGAINITGNTIANLTNGSTSPNTYGGIYGIVTYDGTNTINANTIRDLTVASNNSGLAAISSVIGINQASSLEGQTISGNTIYNLSNSYPEFEGSVIGLYYSGGTDGVNTVSNNFIHSLSVTGTSVYPAAIYGVLLQSGNSTYSNNIISLGGNTKIDIFGIYENCDATNINSLFYNTVYIGGIPTTDSYSSWAFFSVANTNTRIIKNNIFDNARSNSGTASGAHYAAYFDYGTSTDLTLDYNDYYAPGAGGVLGYFNSADVTTVPLIEGQDAHSKNINPGFAGAGGTLAANYLPSATSLVAITGTGIATDYGANARSLTFPAMGAWEYPVTPPCNNFTVGSVAASQSICYNTTPAQLTSVAPTGGNTPYTYQWQNSTNNVDFTDISEATSTNYQPGTLNQTTYYRQKQTSASGCGTLTTNTVTITVYPNFTVGSVRAQVGQTICYNTTPAQLIGTAPTGGNTPYGYQWQNSINNVDFTDISDATGINYQPGTLNQTTYYRQKQTSASGCGMLTTNVVTITVYPNFTVGSAAASQSICYNTTPAQLTGTAPTGGNTPYTYQWQNSTNNVDFTDISEATSTNYQPGTLNQTTYYRQKQTSANGCGTLTTNAVTITVYPNFTVGSVRVQVGQTICYNTTPAQLTSVSPTGGNTPYAY
ncbi:MAG: hypothetical protein NT004_00360, partial [Bacteroidetes bacterium]|nr:hypothetical protein [Bacteroidota bacterium]